MLFYSFSHIKLDRDFSDEKERMKNTYTKQRGGSMKKKATITENRCHLRIFDIEKKRDREEAKQVAWKIEGKKGMRVEMAIGTTKKKWEKSNKK
jgi:osmotically-inducible protein OsmY